MPVELYDLDVERQVLASAACWPAAAEIAVDNLKAAEFHDVIHRKIFAAIAEIVVAGDTAQLDPSTIYHKLRSDGFVDGESALSHQIDQALADLASGGRSRVSVTDKQIKIIKEMSVRRRVREAGGAIAQLAEMVGGGDDKSSLMAQAVGLLEDSAPLDAIHKPVNMQDVADQIINDALTLPKRDIWGLPTGMADGAFDELTGGIQAGRLWVLAGLAGMGKTTFLNAVIRGFRVNNPDAGCPLIATTEMDARSLTQFAVAGAAGVHTVAIEKRDLNDGQRAALDRVRTQKLLDGIYVYYCGGLTIDDVALVARRHKEQHGLPILLIDVASQLKPATEGRRLDQINEIIFSMDVLKTQLNTCIIAITHLNRDVKQAQATGYRPMIWDLRDSGEWENRADKILFIHRANYFGKEDPVTKIIQAKDKHHGQTRDLDLIYHYHTAMYTTSMADNGGGGTAVPPPEEPSLSFFDNQTIPLDDVVVAPADVVGLPDESVQHSTEVQAEEDAFA
jgi:replicative DNA helicase